MIRYAQIKDINSIKKLWNTAFPEDMDFNEYFFENIFKPEYALILEEKDKLIAMLQELPYYMDGIGKIAYIYGVATDPQYRKQGYMAKLLDYSYNQLIEKGVYSILIPATPQLFEYYKKYGYREAFYIDKKTFIKNSKSDIKPTAPDIYKLNEIYEKALENILHPERTPDYWKTQIKMFQSLGGVLYFEDMGYCCYWLGEKPQIQEIFVTDEKYTAEICNYFCNTFNLESVEYSTKGSTPFGMIKGTHNIKGYINLMFN